MSRSIKDLREIVCTSRLSYTANNELELGSTNLNSTMCKTFEANPKKDQSSKQTKNVKKNSNKNNSLSSKTSKSLKLAKSLPDELFCYLDMVKVTGWLERSNEQLLGLGRWLGKAENYCNFCNYWLAALSEEVRGEQLENQMDVIKEEIESAFSSSSQPVDSDAIFSIILHDYKPQIKTKGQSNPPSPHQPIPHPPSSYSHFLHLQALISKDRRHTRKVLSDVKLQTHVKTHVQGALALRAYAVVGLWSGVLDSFRRKHSVSVACGRKGDGEEEEDEDDDGEDHDDVGSKSRVSEFKDEDAVNVDRMMTAISKNHTSVVKYLIEASLVAVDHVDQCNKSLLLHAVVSNRPAVLQLLIQEAESRGSEFAGTLLNHVSDSGNSALHVCVNTLNETCLKLLLSSAYTKVDQGNPLCANATPLHLAIMHNKVSMVTLLLGAGAEAGRGMDGLSMGEVAKNFNASPEILAMLQR